MLNKSACINQLVMTYFISLHLFLFYILLYFLFNIIDEIIKLIDHLFNNALFSYIKYVVPIKLEFPLIIIVLG
jgi:hypothetical protein